jgi:putative transposase
MKNIGKRVLMTTNKIIIENGIYHITQRAPGSEIIFVEDKDYERFLHLLKDTSSRFKTDILCFALLSNHLHILLKTKTKNLDKAMKYLFQRYAQWFNKKYERKGHVFCGAYRAALCNDNDYLIAASLYIHLNPYKAGLTKDVINYKWFSLRDYLKPVKKSFIKTDLILNLVDDKKSARDFYRKLIKDIANERIKFQNILENKSALKMFSNTLVKLCKKNNNNSSSNKTQFVREVCLLDSIMRKIGKMRKRMKFDDKKAFIYCIHQLKSRGYTYREIAERLQVNRTTLYRVLKSNATKPLSTKMMRLKG